MSKVSCVLFIFTSYNINIMQVHKYEFRTPTSLLHHIYIKISSVWSFTGKVLGLQAICLNKVPVTGTSP